MYRRKLAVLAGTAAIMGAVAAPAQSDTATAVCNEAEASWQGGYSVTGSPDPNPPARLYGGAGEAMAIGHAQLNDGLANAAERSPALALCAPPVEDGGGDGDGGGGDGGGGIQ